MQQQIELFESQQIIGPMTRDEAIEWENEVGSAANQLRVVLAEGYERKAWEVLGYSSWSQHLRALAERYGFSENYAWREVMAAKTEKLLAHGQVGEIPERQLRPLSQLDTPEQKREAWQLANESAPNGKVTAAHVQSVVDRYLDLNGQEFDYDSRLDADLDDDEDEELRYQGGLAHCKYCYTTHGKWESSFGDYPIAWQCLNCGHRVADEFMDLREEALPEDRNYKRDNRRATPSDVNAPQGNDACQTPPYAIDPLLPYLSADWLIWEPAAGEGFLVEALYDASRQVTSSDILDGRNFFEYEPDAWDCITTNPPFSITQQWLRRCYELGKPFALLIKVEALGTKGVQELIQKYGFEIMLLDKRIDFKMPFLGWGDEERKSSAQFPVFWLCWQLLPEKVMFGKIDKRGFNGQSD